MIERIFVYMVYFLSDIASFDEVSTLTVYSPSSSLQSQATTIRTRKFLTNRLLNRKQMVRVTDPATHRGCF